MLKFYQWFLLLSLAVLTLVSCEDVVDLPLDPKMELVIFSNFSDQNGLEVYVYKTRNITDNKPTEYIKDALVKVFKGTTLLEELVFVSPTGSPNQTPYYKTLFLAPEFDVEYTIEVIVEGYDIITAKNSIPTPVNLESVTFKPDVSTGTNEDVIVNFEVSVSLADPAMFMNFYHLKFYQELISFNIDAVGDTIWGNTYLEYPTTVDKVIEQSPPIKYQKEQSFLIEDSEFNGQFVTMEFTGVYSFSPHKTSPGRFLVELRTVSEAYYRYYDSLNRQNQNGGQFGEGVVVFNNIDNGLGNFAGFTSKVNSFKLTD